MQVAVIDLGTNTFHLLMASIYGDTHHVYHRERKAVRIGEKGINKGEITPEAWDRAVTALKEFKATIDENGVSQIFATATSAMRNASNGKELVAEIKEQTGIEIEVISGMREAELIHFGASKALNFGKEKNLIMDIGGGSIEFIIADQSKAYWMQSFEVGGQRLVEKFHKTDPIASSEIDDLHNFFQKELQPLLDACAEHEPKTLIGCSGTFDTLSDIYTAANNLKREENATEYPFDVNGFESIYKDLIIKDRDERLAIPGMIEMRVDMIVVACILIEYIIKTLQLENIRVSAYALKEGILHNVLDQFYLNTSE